MTARRGWAGTGSTARWRKVRLLVLARDGYLCQIKGPHCTVIATEVDHVTALADGGLKYDLANLRASCTTCNRGRRTRLGEISSRWSIKVESRTRW